MLNRIDSTIRRLNVAALKAGLILLSILFIYLSLEFGPYIALTAFSLFILWLSIAYVGSPFSYLIALIAALGRSYAAHAQYSPNEPLTAAILRLAINVAIYGSFCYLLSTLYRIVLFLKPSGNPLLAKEHSQFRKIREFIFRPYVNRHWTMSRKLEAIETHYLIVGSSAPLLEVANGETLEITQHDLGSEKLRIVVDRPNWMRGEGELGVSLFYGIDRIYTAMFLMSGTRDDLQIIVGNLQGDGRDRQGLYKEFTKKMHGMRPRDFLIHVVKILGDELGCKEILGISDDAHRSSHWLTHAKKLSTYDAIWIEHGGIKDNSSGFFRISSHVKKRSDDEIPPNKRALYRRRYQFLDELQSEIRTLVLSHSKCRKSPENSIE
jgi:uncharacterized protein VirK/YbjX